MTGLVLVTGGAGFIGHHLVKALVAQGRSVRVIDDLSTGWRVPGPCAQFMKADVTERAREAVEGVELVYHLAANPSIANSMDNPRHSKSDSEATRAILVAAAAAKVRKVIFASSCSIYGDLTNKGPQSPYAQSKLDGENYCRKFEREGRIKAPVLRLFNVYGPGQSEEGTFVIPSMLKRLMEKKPVEITGDGHQTRDFIYIDDVIRAFIRSEWAALPEPVDVGTGKAISIHELALMVKEITGGGLRIEKSPSRPGESRHAEADPRLLARELGIWNPTALSVGLGKTFDWMKKNQLERVRS